MNTKFSSRKTIIAASCGLGLAGGLLATASAQPAAPYSPDADTLFLAHFENGPQADSAMGEAKPIKAGGTAISDGKFGHAWHLKEGETVRYQPAKNISLQQGTVEFFMRPDWDGMDKPARAFLKILGKDNNYLTLNMLGSDKPNRFGGGINAVPGGAGKANFVRFGADISDWKKGQWHYVAVAWDENGLRLNVDGQVRAWDKARAPLGEVESFTFHGFDGAIDEFRVSSTPRRFANAAQPGQMTARSTPSVKAAAVIKDAANEKLEAAAQADILKNFGDPYRYAFELPAAPNGFVVAARSYLDDLDPKVAPKNLGDKTLSTFATPGEYEPLSFAIYATDNLKNVTVSASDLKAGANTISADQITLRTVMRAPERIGYWLSSEVKDYVITNRFLPAFAPFDLQAQQFREIWITVQVPENTAPGDYQGQITVGAAGKPATTLPVNFRVLPFTLKQNPNKKFGTYFRSQLQPGVRDKTVAQLKDIKAHGNDVILWQRSVQYKKGDDGEISWSFHELENVIEWRQAAGFDSGVLFVNAGFLKLAELLGHEQKHDQDNAGLAAALEKDEKFAAIAKAMLLDLKKFASQNPKLEFAILHLDEVFGKGRLPLHIAMAKITRQVPEFKQFVTFHTVNEEANTMRQELDPYVDIRNNHGYSFEWWLARGHTIDEYKKELRESGDTAYYYQNVRTVYNNAEWQRITNGLYMWINPFEARIDWIYAWPLPPKDGREFSGNPFLLGAEGGHWFGFAAPSPDDELEQIPTRNWEAWREGIDDLKYIYTLEDLVRTYQVDDRQAEVREAEEWLQALKAKIPKVQGVEIGATGTPEGEGPLIGAIDKLFSASDYQQMRADAAKYIIDLQAKMKK